MREPIIDNPYLQIGCLLCFVIAIGFWHGILWPQTPIGFGVAAVAFGYTGCVFCLGFPFPPIWVPFFWIFGFLFWFMRGGAHLTRWTARLITPLYLHGRAVVGRIRESRRMENTLTDITEGGVEDARTKEFVERGKDIRSSE